MTSAEEQRALRHTVAGVDCLASKTTGRELFSKQLQRLRSDRLGSVEGHAPLTEIQALQVGRLGATRAQLVREVGTAADLRTSTRDRLQPAHWALQERCR